MTDHPLAVGIRLMPMNTSIESLRAVWKVGDEAGFDHLWNFDHLAPIAQGPQGPCFEGWALLAAMAEATRRVRLGCLVTGNPYRHPGVLAKLASTVDHLSGGRLEFGIGAGWAENEFQMLGMDYPDRASVRIAMLDEACSYLKLLWTEPRADFDGRYYHLHDALHEPKPLQKPHPPIWIGGSGERRTLRVVAKHADVWHTTLLDQEEASRLSSVLDGYCAEAGRDPSEIRRSANLRFHGDDADEVVRAAEGWRERGFSELIITVWDPDAGRNAAIAAERILPRLRG